MLARTPLHEIIDRSKLEPWRKVLLDGADYMAKRGFTKGQLVNPRSGAVCARGAMVKITKEEYNDCGWKYSGEVKRADFELENFLQVGPNGVPDWNNAPERTADEVVSAMRACALQGISA